MAEKIKIFNQSTGQYIEIEPNEEVTNTKTGKVIKITPTIYHVPAVLEAAEKEAKEKKGDE